MRIRPAAALAALLLGTTLLVPVRSEDDYPHGDFEGDCTVCHGGETWLPVVVSPEFRAKEHPFPLKRAHDLPDCRACHRILDFTKATPECVSCHLDPHRGELGIDCARCHVPRTFLDRTRMQEQHQGTRFPLRGSHRALDCEDCHAIRGSGSLRFVNTPSQCVDCHLANYQGASDPNHIAAGFPTECDACHVPTVWEAGRFDHDSAFFPIFSGRHAGRWSTCSTCHVNPTSFSVFSCFACHPHSDPVGTANDHDEVPGFTYNSNACYACHPRGDAP